MAHVLNLANSRQSRVIDLISGTLKLVDHSWATSAPDPKVSYDYVPFGAQPSFENYQPVQETFSLIGNGTAATLLPALKDLEDVMDWVRQFNAGVPSVESWWLEWNADGEEDKRSLIYTMTMDYQSTVPITSPFFECGTIIVKIGLTRHPLWESLDRKFTVATLTNPDSLGVGDKHVFPVIEGTVPARMDDIEILVASSPVVVTETYEYWLGIRPFHQGVANFTPLWQAEDGHVDTDTIIAVDATASHGGAMQTTFVDNTLVRRFYLQVDDIISLPQNASHYRGRYLVLARMKLSAAGTVGVQLRSGYADNLLSEEVYVSSRDWYLYELGEVQIPPWANSKFDDAVLARGFQLSLYAELLDGTPRFNVDYLFLVPSEHMIHVKGSKLQYYADERMRDQLFTLENDTYAALGYTKASPDFVNDGLAIAPVDWYLPQEGGALVMIGQGASAQVMGDTYEVTVYWVPRWLSYRYDEAT